MDGWGFHSDQMINDQNMGDASYFPPLTTKEEEYENGGGRGEEKEGGNIKKESVISRETQKRKRKSQRQSLSQLKEGKEELCETQSSSKGKTKKRGSIDRWSTERYKLAEQTMWEVLKAEGATFEKPISRPDLRLAARKYIGDTGLLDHLLKHIEGKVAPGGVDRFRRWFNTDGTMEYWLESAELDNLRQEAGVNNPFWIPPSTVRALPAPCQETDSSNELKQLKVEMAQMKKDMQELIAMKQMKIDSNMMEKTYNEYVKWKAITDHRLTEIVASLKNVQGNYDELGIWKNKVEQHLVEITTKLNDLQAQREHATSPPSEKWKDWLEGTNPDNNIQEGALATWIGNSELLNVPQEGLLEDPCAGIPTQPLNEELANKKSDAVDMIPTMQEDQPTVTPDSSTTVNSKSDIDNSLIMFQEMFMDLFKWKEKMEQQLLDVSNTLYGMLAMK